MLKKIKIISFVILFSLLFPKISPAKLKTIMEIKGDYLVYSYDHNFFYGEGNLKIKFYNLEIRGERVKIDFDFNVLKVTGEIFLKLESSDESPEYERSYSGDEFTLNLILKNGELLSFKEKIEKKYLDLELKEIEPFSFPSNRFDKISLEKIQSSFVYYTFTRMELQEDFKAIGYGVISHLEGMKLVGFKKFTVKKASVSVPSKFKFKLGKLWYTSGQGIVAEGDLYFLQSDKSGSKTHLHYEERSVLKEHLPPDRILRVHNENKIISNEQTQLSLNVNYDSYSNWSAESYFNKSFENIGSININLSHFHPIGGFNPETWLRFGSSLTIEKIGNFTSSFGYEAKGQFLSSLSFSKSIFKNINIGLSSSYNTIRESDVFSASKIFTGNISLNYQHKYLNLASSYSLNRDYIAKNSLIIPQISLNLANISFYGNLLNLNISNNLYYYISQSPLLGKRTEYSDNLIFSLSTSFQSIPFLDNINLSLRAEELFKQDRDDYLSTGFGANFGKDFFGKNLSLNVVYIFNNYRKSKNWFLEGTSYQDLSSYINFTILKKLEGNISINADVTRRKLINSFMNFALKLWRGWYIDSNVQYDFLNKRINNVDFYLIRDMNKFDLRVIWRHLTKQILIELVPK